MIPRFCQPEAAAGKGTSMQSVDTSPLFTPFTLKNLKLPNRFVMPGMQRQWCVDGKPVPKLVDYYKRRVLGGTPIVITESCAVDHGSATQEPTYARMNDATVGGWAECFSAVREVGGHIFLQLWHEGAVRREGGDGPYAHEPTLSPSGIRSPGRLQGRAATLEELAEIRDGFAHSALLAKQAGADGVEVHACHGYLLDLFLWEATNQRTDGYGGPELTARVRFPAEVVAAVRAAVGPDMIVSFRFSQWKQADYDAKIVRDPAELKVMLDIIAKAGADVFHASTRRFFTPEWAGSSMGLAGWTKSLTTLPVIACGSVGVDTDIMDNFLVREAQKTGEAGVAELVRRFNNNEFDLISVGRANIGDPDWVKKVRDGRYNDILSFTRQDIMPVTRNKDGVRLS
jgi:2,4-dienoyl-CoA reductase-like NADH-dependent reductase (Old Yellow Enzyme family)